MKLSIIIVSYNTAQLTVAAVESALADIAASPHLANESEIIVIDNNSSDDSVTKLKKLAQQHHQITVLPQEDNLGFAKANNLGIHKAKGALILLLNSDTLVKPGALETMVKIFEQHPIKDSTATLSSYHGALDRLGILTPQLLNPDGSNQPQGGNFPNLLSLTVHMLMLDDIPLIGRLLPSTQHTGLNTHLLSARQEVIQSDWVAGTAMMIRREVIAEIGDLDGNIFMYGEDVEYCLRAKHHHWDVAVTPQAQITHYGSASTGSAGAIIGELKGYIYIWAKHFPDWQLPLVRVIIKAGCHLRRFIFSVLNQPKKIKIYTKALKELRHV